MIPFHIVPIQYVHDVGFVRQVMPCSSSNSTVDYVYCSPVHFVLFWGSSSWLHTATANPHWNLAWSLKRKPVLQYTIQSGLLYCAVSDMSCNVTLTTSTRDPSWPLFIHLFYWKYQGADIRQSATVPIASIRTVSLVYGKPALTARGSELLWRQKRCWG